MRAARKSGLESRTLSTLGVLLAPGVAVGCVALRLLPRAGELKGGLDRLRPAGVALPLLARRDLPKGGVGPRKPQEGFTRSIASQPSLSMTPRPYP